MSRKAIALLILMCAVQIVQAQIRIYAQYESLPFEDGFSRDFKLITGVRIDPNKELEIGLGLAGRFNPQNFKSDIKYSQSSFSLGFNYYHTRRLYYNIDVSLSLLNDLIDDLIVDPLDFSDESYLNYRINVNYIVLRRLHFSTGIGLADFPKLLADTGGDLIKNNRPDLNLAISLKLYLFQIKY